jgi:hypothetical protein
MNPIENSASESRAKLILSFFASAGFLLLFALIIWLTYLPTYSSDVNPTTRMEQEAKLVESRAAATKLLENYSIVNPAAGVYRIPIEKAMELTVEHYRK